MSDLRTADFGACYAEIHGYDPFPWQVALLERVAAGRGWPASIDVPTGLGKTSVIDVAVFAAALGCAAARRRTYLVVDRRPAVDEGYLHACRISERLRSAAPSSVVGRVAAALRVAPDGLPLEVVRIRGGAHWSWKWLERPDQYAVVLGTVDEIGSRVFFRGHGVGDGGRPIDAALTATDSLILLAGTHSAGPFLTSLRALPAVEPAAATELPTVVAMSACPGSADAHGLTAADDDHPVARRRLHAAKRLHLVEMETAAEVASALADWALRLGGDRRLTGVVCNTVATARAVFARLGAAAPGRCLLLTGQIRPIDRAYLLAEWYERIRAGRTAEADGPLYLVATRAVEAGANIDLDGLVTEASSLPALVQRLGRLNRFGDRGPATAVMLRGSGDADTGGYGEAATATWDFLAALTAPLTDRRRTPPEPGAGLDVSPAALRSLTRALDPAGWQSMTGPAPDVPALTGAVLDAWTATSPRPVADPAVEPFLHGIDRAFPQVAVVWRADLDPADQQRSADSLVAMPPRADEAIELPLAACRRWLAGAEAAAVDAAPRPPIRALRYAPGGGSMFVGPDEIRSGDVLVVPARSGGCDAYGWDPAGRGPVVDVADLAPTGNRDSRRIGLRLGPALAAVLRDRAGTEAAAAIAALGARIGLDGTDSGIASACRELFRPLATAAATPLPHQVVINTLAAADRPRLLGGGVLVCSAARTARDGDPLAPAATGETGARTTLLGHQRAVAHRAGEFATRLGLPERIVNSVVLAGLLHDEGKRDPRFQLMLHWGDRRLAATAPEALAKSGMDPFDWETAEAARLESGYPDGMRHEPLSARIAALRLQGRPDVDPDLVIHLVTTHHGWGRPLNRPVCDPDPATVTVDGVTLDTARTVDPDGPARAAALAAVHGRWGLARLEAIVRFADMWCSAREESLDTGPALPPARPAPAGPPARAVEIPGLDGRDPLGFLAALGLLRLLNTRGEVRLSFAETTACAVLTGDHGTIDEVVEVLAALVAESGERAIVGVHPDLPYRAGTGPDPMRLPRARYPELLRAVTRLDPEFAAVWLPALLTDLAVDAAGRAAITPFLALHGGPDMRTFFAAPLDAVRRDPGRIREALTAVRNDGGGHAGQGAGAAWLATMALPLLRLAGDGTRRSAALWRTVDDRTFMIWPLWREPLTGPATRVLLDHPAFQPRDAAPTVCDRDWPALNVFGSYAAEYRPVPGTDGEGHLTPVPVSTTP